MVVGGLSEAFCLLEVGVLAVAKALSKSVALSALGVTFAVASMDVVAGIAGSTGMVALAGLRGHGLRSDGVSDGGAGRGCQCVGAPEMA